MNSKILALIVCVLIANCTYSQSTLTNQKLSDTIGFMPDYYSIRIEIFNKEPVITGRVVFLGNSITQIGDWGKLLNDSTVINRGIAGDITFGVLKRLDDIIRLKPSKVFLMIGINDIGKDIPDEVIAGNIRKIIIRLKKESPSTMIYIQSILPVNPEVPNFPQHYDKQEHILNTNKLVKKVAKETNCTYVNIHDLFTNRKGQLDANLTPDGLHLAPGKGGYEKWIAYLKKQGYL